MDNNKETQSIISDEKSPICGAENSFAPSENTPCETAEIAEVKVGETAADKTETAELTKNDTAKAARLTEKQKAEERKKKKKRMEQAAFRSKYFSYYDDVKTNIKEDW